MLSKPVGICLVNLSVVAANGSCADTCGCTLDDGPASVAKRTSTNRSSDTFGQLVDFAQDTLTDRQTSLTTSPQLVSVLIGQLQCEHKFGSSHRSRHRARCVNGFVKALSRVI